MATLLSPPSPASASDVSPLAAKYAVPGPRYTSYPPANRFHADIASLDLEGAIRDDNRPGAGPVSLYFHLPFCASRCWYCGCTTIITRQPGMADRYLDDLARELDLTVALMDRNRPVDQLHLGGGTPTFFTPPQLLRLRDLVHERFSFTLGAEISVEIDPRAVTPAHVGALRALGVNRASLGIQDTQREVQEGINRIQPHALNLEAVRWLREAGITALNLDLIYGLPRQTTVSLARTVADALELAPDRLSVFSYAHVPWIKPTQRIFERRGELPRAEEKLAQFAVIRDRLLAAGYEDIGLDHFARPDDELARARREGGMHRNFQGYSTRSGASLYSFGISSISQTPDTYRQNTKSLADYRAALDAGRLPVERGYRLTPDDHRRRELIMGVMCRRELDFTALGESWGIPVAAVYPAEVASLQELADDGLIELRADGLRVLPRGEPWLRVIAMRFDAAATPVPGRHALAV
jgi:oxygen-independent coproporphyrinogen III oxidase